MLSTDFSQPRIMGILNVTPDSFSDGGCYNEIDHAVKHAQQMIREGADIIDIGGESTRPGSDPVADKEQIRRVVPVINALRRQNTNVMISIDTCSAVVAKAALDAGATMINDVSGGRGDQQMLSLAAQCQVPIVLMHAQGTPKDMQNHPQYDNVINEVFSSLKDAIHNAQMAGVANHAIIADVGIGFGKTRQHNLNLLAHLQDFMALNVPLLLGTSRKRFMGAICQINDPKELVTATAVTTALGVMAGVSIFRVHDVAQNRQALDVALAIKHSTSL